MILVKRKPGKISSGHWSGQECYGTDTKKHKKQKKKNAAWEFQRTKGFFDSKGKNHLGKMNNIQTGKTIRKQRMCQEINIQNIESTIQLINWLINLNNPFFFWKTCKQYFKKIQYYESSEKCKCKPS